MSHLYFRIAPPAIPGLLEKVTSCALNSAAGAAIAAGPMSIAAGTMRSLAIAKAGMGLAYAASIVLMMSVAGAIGYGAHHQIAQLQQEWHTSAPSWPQQETAHVERIERR